MASVRGLAVGSGAAFTLGSVGGVLGNNLNQGGIFWGGYVTLTALGAGVAGWLTYRAAAPGVPAAVVNHKGNNTVGPVTSNHGGPAIGVSYGSVQGASPDSLRGVEGGAETPGQ